MFYFFLGAVSVSLAYFFTGYMKRRQLRFKWWGWLLSFLWLVYTLFVAAMAFTLFRESAPRAALVSLVVFGFVSVITAVVLFRFVLLQENAGKRSRS